MNKKKGGLNNFSNSLIKDKANFLAYYFKINGITKFKNINKNLIYDKIYLIIINYNDVTKSLIKDNPNKRNFKLFVDFIKYYNGLYNINNYNYGSEGHIIKYLFYNYNEKQYVNQLKTYLTYIKTDEIKDETLTYTMDDFMKKLGAELAIYNYMYNIQIENDLKIQEEIEKSFIKYFVEGFHIEANNIIDKYKNELYKYTKPLFPPYDNDDIILQKVYNIITYPMEIVKDAYGKPLTINFINTRKLTFDIPEDFYITSKDFSFKNDLFTNIITIN